MKIALFILGLILCISSFGLFLHGPRRYVQYESENLGSWTSKISPESSKEVVWFNPRSIWLVASNLTLFVGVDSFDVELFIHVLDESQFETWQRNQSLNQSLISKIVISKLDFSFELEASHEIYHFVAENPSNTTADAHVSLVLAGDFLRFDYTLAPLYVVLFAAGIITCLTSRGELKSRFDEFLKKWSLPVYRRLKNTKEDEEKARLCIDAMLRLKRISKYFVLVLLGAIGVYFMYDIFLLARGFVNWQPFRPEYSILIIDMVFRNATLRIFIVLPMLIGAPMLLIFIVPRMDDLADVVKSILGLEKRKSKKQWRISEHTYRKGIATVFSSRFLILLVILFLPLLLISYSSLWEMQIVKAASFMLLTAALGIWVAYIMWSGFHEVCAEHGISEYSAERHMKLMIVDFVLTMSLYIPYVTLLLLLIVSDFWMSTVKSIVIEPVTLFEPASVFSEFPSVKFGVFVGIISIALALIICAFMFFLLFPFLYRMGPKGIMGVFLVFSLTYVTEYLITWVLEGPLNVIIQPIGLVSPLTAAIVSWIFQGKYEKMIKKRLPPVQR